MNISKTQDEKLTSQIESEAKNKRKFFFALWLLNAVTTFVFGMNYIDGLYSGILTPLRMGDYGTMAFSQVLGGLSALLVLDIAYKKWAEIAKTSSTNIQLGAAKVGGNVAFYMSLAFSAIVFVTTAFTGLVSVELIETLDMIGAGSFVAVVIVHLVCWRTFSEGGAAEIEYSDRLKFQADNHTEVNAIKRTVQNDALLETRNKMKALKSAIADKQSDIIVASIIADMLNDGGEDPMIIDGDYRSADTPIEAPAPSPIGFGAKAQQGDMSKAELARRAIVDFVGDTPMRYTDIVSTCVSDGHNEHTVKRQISELSNRGTLSKSGDSYTVA